MDSEEVIDYLQEIPLSGADLMELVRGKSKVVRYSNLHKYDTIEELLHPYNCIFLLYETRERFGHWVCVILHPDGVLEFFDPYGYFIDEQLNFVPNHFRQKSHQQYPFLSRLFLNSPYKITWNKMKLQKHEEDNNSCGRHIGLRVALRDYPLEAYQKIMKSGKGLSSDDKATYFTAFL
jgi:hypothetical protein